MSKLLTPQFWYDTAERAIKTTAQAAVAVIGTGAIGIIDVDWANIGSVSLLAGVVSVLTSIATIDATGSSTLTPTDTNE